MNAVEPIRDYDTLLDIANHLKLKSERNYVLFMFGVYMPIRISDMLKLRVRDVSKGSLSIREKKTSHEQMMPFNPELKKILKEYTKNLPDHAFLFPSTHNAGSKPLTRQQAYNIISAAGKQFGLQKIGCHTMRKTFGYHYYQSTHDIVQLQGIFNHSDPNITKMYIGLTQKMKNDAIANFRYKKHY
jgi:integrase